MRILLGLGLLSFCFFAMAQTQQITLLQLNDLHAHLIPHKNIDHESGRIVERGGLARIATLIKQVRQENPDTLVMNIGDTYHGGVEALYTQGNAIVAPVNALGIDVGVPGNWDFAYGPNVTRLRYNPGSALFSGQNHILPADFPYLAANVYNAFPNRRSGELFLPATLIKQVAEFNVGFVGLSSDIVAQMHPTLAFGFDFVQGEALYIELINHYATQLRKQGADIVVVMSELGIHKDVNLANEIDIDLVDVFFSAHTHEVTSKPVVSQSGA